MRRRSAIRYATGVVTLRYCYGAIVARYLRCFC